MLELKENEYLFLDLLIHITVLTLILVIFFVFVVSIVEKTAINKEVKNAIDNGLNSYNPPPDPTVKADLEDIGSYFSKSGNNSADEIYNTSLIYYSLFFLLLLIMSVLLSYSLLKYSAKRKINILSLIIFNLLVFICIGAIEVVFFLKFVINYVPVKPSYMIKLINKRL